MRIGKLHAYCISGHKKAESWSVTWMSSRAVLCGNERVIPLIVLLPYYIRERSCLKANPWRTLAIPIHLLSVAAESVSDHRPLLMSSRRLPTAQRTAERSWSGHPRSQRTSLPECGRASTNPNRQCTKAPNRLQGTLARRPILFKASPRLQDLLMPRWPLAQSTGTE